MSRDKLQEEKLNIEKVKFKFHSKKLELFLILEISFFSDGQWYCIVSSTEAVPLYL